MKLILKNIGLLEQAEITLHPLCVIAGENDNGKSTVGKIIFCIVKAINRYKEDLKVSKNHQIGELLRQAFFDLRRVSGDEPDEAEHTLQRLRFAFIDDTSLEELITAFNEVVADFYSRPNASDEFLSTIRKLEHEVKQIIAEPEDSKKAIEQAFAKVFTAEFDSEVLLDGATEGMIQLWENDLCLIDLKVEVNNKVRLMGDVEPIELKDATFIETPLILNFHDALARSQTLLETASERRSYILPYTTLHTKDLFDKLRQPAMVSSYDDVAVMFSLLQATVQGEIEYSRKSRDFVFNRNGAQRSIKNTASGIKSFGVLQILLSNGFLNKNSLLVLDEPENHLHPKWQIKMAELLVSLAATGVFIVVSAHSPYMIEALERYAEKLKLKQNTGFYLADNNRIENENKLEQIFELLAEPFQQFQAMDAEVMRDE